MQKPKAVTLGAVIVCNAFTEYLVELYFQGIDPCFGATTHSFHASPVNARVQGKRIKYHFHILKSGGIIV